MSVAVSGEDGGGGARAIPATFNGIIKRRQQSAAAGWGEHYMNLAGVTIT